MKNKLRHLMTWLCCCALLGTVVLGLPASRVSSASSVEILKPVSQNIDDGFYGTWGFYPGLVWNESGNPGQPYNAWYRFTGIYLPKGSTILEAHLEIMETRWTSGTKLSIYADKSAEPVAPGSTATARAKVRTTAYVDWPSGYSDGLYHNSPDFAPVIQELVNVNDYSNGAIQILVDNNSSSPGTEMVGRTFEYGAPPRLFIKYQASGSMPVITSISPPAGSAGTNFEVTIFGSNFGDVQGTSKVEFWQRTTEYTSAVYTEASVVSWSNSQITCRVPPLAGGSRVFDGKTRGVQVTTSSGTSNNLPFKITFATNGDKWYGPNPMGTRFFVNDTLANNSQALQAVLDAAQSWNNVSGANFYFEYGGRTSVIDGQTNGVSEIIWKPFDASILAFAFHSTPSPIVEGDVYLNSNKPWIVDGSTPYDIQAIVTHELGHWLFLKDLYGDLNMDQVMYGSVSGQRTPTPDDMEGIRYLYPGTGTRGQYHVEVTNNSGKPLSIYFKADSNTDLSPVLEVPAGQTVTSWSRVVEAGNHSVTLQWNDPDTGTANSMTSSVMNVPIEGNTGYSFVVPDGTPSPVTSNTTGTVASAPQPTGGANEYALNLTITGTTVPGLSAGQQVWFAATTTDFPNLLTVGATVSGNLDNSLGWWVLKKAAGPTPTPTPVEGNTTGTVASTPQPTGGANEYALNLKITSTTVPGLSAGQQVWLAATTTDFPDLLTVGATVSGNLDNSLGWWVLKKAV